MHQETWILFLPKPYNETRHLFQNAQVTESYVDYIQVPSCMLPFYTHSYNMQHDIRTTLYITYC